MVRWLLVLGAMGCVRSASTTCDDGRVCPAGTVCDDVNAACVEPGQLTSCAELTDGAICDIGEQPIGVCVNGVCLGHACGDGRKTGPEMCDPSAPESTSTCSALGYYMGGDVTCTASCDWDRTGCAEFCGDGLLNGNELCEGDEPPHATCLDFGFDRGRLGCGGCAPSFSSCGLIGWRARPFAAGTIGVFGASASGGTVYAAGGNFFTGQGVVLRLGNTTWDPVGTFPAGTPLAVWAVSNDDIWVAGGTDATTPPYGAIFHYNGTAWETVRVTDGLATGIWATGSHVWVIEGATVHHFDGTTWSTQDAGGSIEGISGTSESDVWLVGAGGVLHSSGGAFAPFTGAPATARAVHAFAPGKVALVESLGFNMGLRAHVFDGSAWSSATFTGGTLGKAAIVALDTNDLYVHASFGMAELVVHHDGSRWRHVGSPSNVVDAVVGSSSTGVVVLDTAASYHFSGSAWLGAQQPPTRTRVLWGMSPDDLYASQGASSVLYHFDGSSWTAAGSARGTADGIDTNVVYSMDGSTLWRKGPSSWTSAASLPATARPPIAVRGVDDVFVGVGGSTIHHWNGTAFTPTNVNMTSVSAMDCSAQGECFLVGDAGAVVRTDGTPTASAPVSIGTAVNLTAVWIAAPSQIFIGGLGVLAWYDGTTWHQHELPTQSAITAIHGSSSTDVFAVTESELLHFDGTSWQPVRQATHINTRLDTVLATGADVFVTGTSQAGNELDQLVRISPW